MHAIGGSEEQIMFLGRFGCAGQLAPPLSQHLDALCLQERPRAVNAAFNRETNSLPLEAIPAEWIEAGGGKESVPVITHCGGGGRGQKAKDYLLSQGFKNVQNGGGPEDDECWAVFGDK